MKIITMLTLTFLSFGSVAETYAEREYNQSLEKAQAKLEKRKSEQESKNVAVCMGMAQGYTVVKITGIAMTVGAAVAGAWFVAVPSLGVTGYSFHQASYDKENCKDALN